MSPIRACLSALSPAGARGRLSVLIFHRVLQRPDPIFPDEIDAARFDQVLGWLRRWFHVLPLDEAVRCLKQGTLPARAAAITFDDGYADNRSIALPILQRHSLPATFFIATGFLDGGRMWNDTVIESVRRCRLPALDLSALGLGAHELQTVEDRRIAIRSIIRSIKYRPVEPRRELTEAIAKAAQVRPPVDLMMSSQQVRELRRAGMQIGAHTVSHPILAQTDIETARREMAESRRALAALLGEPVGLFAYPNGRAGTDYLPEHAQLAAELGFDAAVATDWGTAGADTDIFQLPRFTPWDRSQLPFALRLMRNLRAPPSRPSSTPSIPLGAPGTP